MHLRTFSKEFRGWGNRENRWNYSGSLNLLTSSGRKLSGQRELRQVSLPWGWFHPKGKKGRSPERVDADAVISIEISSPKEKRLCMMLIVPVNWTHRKYGDFSLFEPCCISL